MKSTSIVKPRVPRKARGYRPPYKFVEIVWDDAASNSESWVAIKDVSELEQVITRGWLVKETVKFVCIAGSVSNEEDHEEIVGNTLSIPLGMIVSRRELSLSTVKTKVKKAKDEPSPVRSAE